MASFKFDMKKLEKSLNKKITKIVQEKQNEINIKQRIKGDGKMKRLLKISFDTLLTSIFPILSWFVLSIILDKNLINVFSLTFPLQFIGWMLGTIFATGANINKEKDKNDNAVMSGITIGTVIGFFIFGFVILNIDKYINFMNMDVFVYKEFAIYSAIQIYLGFIFNCIIEKLYFEAKNTKANKYSTIYNLINFIALILLVLIVKEKMTIVIIASIIRLICVLVVVFRNFDKFQLKFSVLKYIKYESFSVFRLFMLFITFLIGFKVAFNFGEQYVIALTFIGVISDTQWDLIITAINSVAKIDISKNEFNYKEHMKNAYKLCGLVIISLTIMSLVLWQYYEVPVFFTLILIFFEIYNFIIYPIIGINTSFLQLNYSAKVTTSNHGISSIVRFAISSLLNTPYCTTLGQTISATYEMISTSIIFIKNYRVTKNGEVKKILKMNKI